MILWFFLIIIYDLSLSKYYNYYYYWIINIIVLFLIIIGFKPHDRPSTFEEKMERDNKIESK